MLLTRKSPLSCLPLNIHEPVPIEAAATCISLLSALAVLSAADTAPLPGCGSALIAVADPAGETGPLDCCCCWTLLGDAEVAGLPNVEVAQCHIDLTWPDTRSATKVPLSPDEAVAAAGGG